MTDLLGHSLPISLARQLAEFERELALRRRNYPRLVKDGQLSAAAADRRIVVMEAMAHTLRRLA